MELNKSPLSGYHKSNKALTLRKSTEARVLSESSKLKDSSSLSQAMKLPELKEGQVVKGQVIDLRYQEVTISLEPGKQVVNAKISGDVPLSIGQEAQFQVTEDSSKQLVLKYMPDETTAPSDATAIKALSASNLPMTKQNKALVTELLNHRMPVDKQTLQSLIRVSLANREASPLTLVLMYKNNIPMSSANIKQFEAYQNGTHQLLKDLQTISHNITDLIKDPEMLVVNDSISQGQVLLQQVLDNTVPTGISTYQQALQMNSKLIDLLSNTKNIPALTTQLNMLLNQQELSLLGNLIEQKFSVTPDMAISLPSDLMQQIASGTMTLEESSKLITTIFPGNTGQSGVLSDLSLPNTASAAALISKILEHSVSSQDASAPLSSLLNQEARTSLLHHLAEVPELNNIKERIIQGNARVSETLNFIQDSLAQADTAALGELLKALEYSKLLEGAFLQKWTITADKVADKEAVSNLFLQLKEDLEQLSLLTSTNKEAESLLRNQEPIKNAQENLHFMKDLNEVFTYLQLPVQFQNRETHTDLYVMTRKRALGDKKEALSVLLHLDMTNLGSLNIHIKLEQDKVLTTFYLDDAATMRLVSDNLPVLTSALEKKGYDIRAEVKTDYKKPDFSKDFIEESSQDNNIQRYSFDIRT